MTLAYAEAGVGCPLSMTYSVVPALRADPELAAEWEPASRHASTSPASGRRPRSAASSPGWRSPSARAAPTCARTRRGRSRSPTAATRSPARSGSARRRCATSSSSSRRRRAGSRASSCRASSPDGERNGFHLRRLKDKLGNRSNASAEIELRDAVGGAARRGGARRRDDHRHGRPHAARLRARLDRPHAPRGRGGDAPRGAPRGVRAPARRAAAPPERPRRPLPRLRGGDGDGAPARARGGRG